MTKKYIDLDVWKSVKESFKKGHISHSYIIEGDPSDMALDFTFGILELLFCKIEDNYDESCSNLIRQKKNVDILWLEPTSKSRQIVVEDIDRLINQMHKTSFYGGWKAGVIINADRLQIAAEQKLLKILEEPPPKSILLLISENSSALLKTIRSRCQTLHCNKSIGLNDSNIYSFITTLPPKTGIEAVKASNSVLNFLSKNIKMKEEDFIKEQNVSNDEIEKEVLEARVSAFRKKEQLLIVEQILYWFRDILTMQLDVNSSNLIYPSFIERLEEVSYQYSEDQIIVMIKHIEELGIRINKNLPESQIWQDTFRKLVI